MDSVVFTVSQTVINFGVIYCDKRAQMIRQLSFSAKGSLYHVRLRPLDFWHRQLVRAIVRRSGMARLRKEASSHSNNVEGIRVAM